MFRKFLPLLIVVIAIVLSLVIIRSRPDPEQNDPVEQAVLVETMTVNPQDAYITVMSQGTVEPRTRTNLVSEVSGQVIEVSPAFVAGGFFRKGDVLIKLDDRNYRAAVSRNEAALATARSQLEQERGQGDVAQREFDRLSAEQQAQVRAKDLYLRKPQMAEAVARLEAAEADLEQSVNDLNKTTIIAPYDGLVSAKNTDIGQYVTSGSTVAETFAVDYAEVRLPIPENKIPFLNLPAALQNFDGSNTASVNRPEVELISRIGNEDYSWTGVLTRTEGVLDTRTRVLFSVVQIEDPYGLYNDNTELPLRIGTYVNAAIQGQLMEDVFVLPRYTLQANNLVWIADSENRLRAREVTVVTTNGDNVFISAGLEAGDKVVMTRLENPLNGMIVETDSQSFISIE